MYCSLPSSRMRLSRSSRYFRRSASGSKARSVIPLHYAAAGRFSSHSRSEVGGGLFHELGELGLGRLTPRGAVLGGPEAIVRLVLLEHLAGDGHAVDVVGTVVDPGR